MKPTSIINETLVNRAKALGQKEAIYEVRSGKRYSYKELLSRANQLNYFLSHHLQLAKGDRIAFCAENSVEFIDSFYMSAQTGIIITTYNFLLNPVEITKMMANEEPKVLFYCAKSRDKVKEIADSYNDCLFISLDTQKDEFADFYYSQDIMTGENREFSQAVELSIDDTQMLIHTGGTTGFPKAAKISYRAIMFNAISEIMTLDLTSQATSLLMLPFYHTAAWNVLTLPLLYAGGRVIILGGFSDTLCFDIIAQERPTVAIGVETIYKRLAKHERFASADFSCFSWLLSGAAPISHQAMLPYWEKGVKLINAYGATETGPNNIAHPVTQLSLEEVQEKWAAAGKVMMFNQLKIVDSNLEEVSDGQRGELIWRGPLTFSGYWNQTEKADSILPDGWVRSGDIGYKDAEGYIYISGRMKNTIISGGENIYPLEIEKLLLNHQAIADVCIIGVEDEEWGECGKALIVLAPGQRLTVSEINIYLKQFISPFKLPKYFDFIEEIPKNPVGKVDYQLIKKTYARVLTKMTSKGDHHENKNN